MIKRGNDVIVSSHKMCNSIISKAFGLRFRRSPKDSALIFTFRKPRKVVMDMWFVFYPIDVVFLDSENKVVEIKESFKPWSFYASKNDVNVIIEFESGVVKKNNILVGDKLEIA